MKNQECLYVYTSQDPANIIIYVFVRNHTQAGNIRYANVRVRHLSNDNKCSRINKQRRVS